RAGDAPPATRPTTPAVGPLHAQRRAAERRQGAEPAGTRALEQQSAHTPAMAGVWALADRGSPWPHLQRGRLTRRLELVDDTGRHGPGAGAGLGVIKRHRVRFLERDSRSLEACGP